MLSFLLAFSAVLGPAVAATGPSGAYCGSVPGVVDKAEIKIDDGSHADISASVFGQVTDLRLRAHPRFFIIRSPADPPRSLHVHLCEHEYAPGRRRQLSVEEGWMHGMDGWMDGCIDWMDGWMH